MKRLKRSGSRLAFVLGLGLAPLSSCASDPTPPTNISQTGTLGLPLQAVGQSGAVYRLRDAFFEITDVRTGQQVEFLFSEDAPPESAELRQVLEAGNYTVQLLDGWFIERVSGGNSGSGGAPGTGGSIGSSGEASSTGGFPGGGFSGFGDDDDGSFGGEIGEGGASTAGVGNEGGSGGSFGGKGGVGKGGRPGTGGTGTAGTSGGNGRVEARLVSDAIQFFSIFGFSDSFVTFTFSVGEEELDFDHGRLHIGIDIIENADACEVPADFIDPGRVMLETNVEAVSTVGLRDVFSALAQNSGFAGDPERLFDEIYESYATEGNGQLDDAIHCGDETTGGEPSLNGFPIECDRIERLHVGDIFAFQPLAFVNRLDLAPQNGAHCGQQRMIFGTNSLGRAFMIVEAQIPNPAPELGIQGCAPLAQFWLDQNLIDDPVERGFRLAEAFLIGSPQLADFGFGPFYSAENVTVGSGQIRTNQFDQDPWTLREFKLALNEDNSITSLPFPTSESPNGGLWDENLELPQGEACRENFVNAVGGLLTDDPAAMSFVVDQACKDAESRNDGSQNYSFRMSDGFRETLDALGSDFGLTADDLANRAQFSGSCIGCHEEAQGKFLGQGVFAPFSNSFTHVQESVESCRGRDRGLDCFQTSSGIKDTFLPSRLQVLAGLLGVPLVENPCDGGGGVGGAPGSGGASPGTGGRFAAGGGPIGSGGTVGVAGSFGMDPGQPVPAPEVEIALPSAAEPIEELQRQDEEIREAYGEQTLSGRSAQSTH
jgi:hypothetical protein